MGVGIKYDDAVSSFLPAPFTVHGTPINETIKLT